MRIHTLIIPFFLLLAGCEEVLRDQNFELDQVSNPEQDFKYEVVGYTVTPEIVSRANQSPFLRYASIGGTGVGPVLRVPERDLFAGPKPPANKRIEYTIGVGDSIQVIRAGFSTTVNGVQTKQAINNSYLVDERGAVDLLEGRSVVLGGLTIELAKSVVEAALSSTSSPQRASANPRSFPGTHPGEYRLGVGDIVRVSRLNEVTNSNGSVEQKVETSLSTVGSNGFVSILQLGEIEAVGLTLSQIRDRAIQEAIRTASGIDTVVEIQNFDSKKAFVSGDLGTHLISITDKPLTYGRLLAQLKPNFSGDRDYRLTLERGGETYHAMARDLMLGKAGGNSFVFDGDRLIVAEQLPETQLDLKVVNYGAKFISYLRVTDDDAALAQQGKMVSFDIRGIDLRQLLISQGIDLTKNEDLLIKLSRGKETFRLSAQSVVLDHPSRRYWLAPDDHVVVEDIAYSGENALIVGEVGVPKQLPVNQHSRTTLSQALFDSGAFSATDADFSHVYVLRGGGLKYDAYHFDISQVLNLGLVDSFELRPGDIMFVRTRPITRYTRALAIALNFVNVLDVGITNARTFGN